MVAFGLAPALVMFVWQLKQLGKLGWFVAFVYTAAAALRLARFNTQIGIADKRYFQGLPSPSAAAIVAGAIWVAVEHQLDGAWVAWVGSALTLSAGLLMVSNVRFNSFKEIDPRNKVPFIVLVLVMLGVAVASWHPPIVLFGIFLVYAISGPVLTLVQLRKRRAMRKSAASQ